jgi:CHAT domain-containing protein
MNRRASLAVIAALLLARIAAAQESPVDLLAAAKAQYVAHHYADALALYEKARAAGDASGDAIAVAWAKLGMASVKSMRNEVDAGIALADEARAAFEAAGNHPGLAEAYRQLGNLHMGRARYETAIELFHQCVQVADSDFERSTCLQQRGGAEVSVGRPRQAMASLRESIDLAIASNNRGAHIAALGTISDVHLAQGNAELAIYFGEKAVAMAREIDSPIVVSMQLNNLAIAYSLAGLHERSLAAYRENLAMMERLHYTRGIVVSKMNIANELADVDRDEEATQMLDSLLPILEHFEDPDSKANILRLLAALRERCGDYGVALDLAIDSAAQPSDDWKDVYLSAALIGHLYRKIGRPDEAGTALTRAIQTIEQAHDDLSGDEPRFFSSERNLIYAEMAGLRIDEGRVEEALAYAERYRSRILIGLLHSTPADRSRTLSDEERTREDELLKRLADLQREARGKTTPELEERLTQAQHEYDALEHDLADAHPRLRVERGTLPPVSVAEVGSRLRGAVLIEYLVAADRTYAFVIAGNSMQVRTIDITARDLTRRAEAFHELLAQRRPDFRTAARSLHQMLLAPIADLIGKHRTWILIPDGPLWNLPFQALLDARGSYVAERAAIVYAPSIAAWVEMSRPAVASATKRGDLLAFGNPTTPAGDSAERTRGKLAPLPEAEVEVRNAARFYSGRNSVHVRDEATEERFKREASQYRVLHLAGHGVLNDASPMHSYLLLAASTHGAEDGYLEARELMQMDLGAELVVLSACETARGKYAAGEGIIGFSWALFASRCRTQVVSQWKVDSAATSVLMRSFHQNVSADRQKAASALQKSIVSMLKTKEYRHPFYWAGFVVLGDAR